MKAGIPERKPEHSGAVTAETYSAQPNLESMTCRAAWPLSHLQNNQLHKVSLAPKPFGLCLSITIWVQHDS